MILWEIVYFAVPEIKGDFHILWRAFARHANSCKRVDVGGGVLDGAEVVRIGGELLALVKLAGVVGGDAGVHY